jgi:hypothetical protein
LNACIEAHERHHVRQIEHICPDCCNDLPAGGAVGFRPPQCKQAAECFALVADLKCLYKKKGEIEADPARAKMCLALVKKQIKDRSDQMGQQDPKNPSGPPFGCKNFKLAVPEEPEPVQKQAR